jgi:formiminotetrahydrofolate cyclodeaminase
MALTERSVREFCAALAAEEPAPGGGYVAAVAGARAAAMCAMVCNYTIGRRRFAAVDAEFQALVARADRIRDDLLDLVEADADAYRGVVDARALPKDTPEQSAERERRVQEALLGAIRVPLRTAVLAADVLALCEPIAERGNPQLISDAGVAALLSEAALGAAALNVRANLGAVSDGRARSESQAVLARLLSAAHEVKPRVMSLVESKLG